METPEDATIIVICQRELEVGGEPA
jgi:hypothetical protein